MLDHRSQVLLKSLIEHYISDGQPVGSRTLAKSSTLDLSAATIRNVMSDLEDMGFIKSPHTSAGRVPTPMGYRVFVDTLVTVKPLATQEILFIQDTFQPGYDQKELMAGTANMLSRLTQYVGVVLSPKRKNVAFRHMEFLALSDKKILLILVASDGSVQNRITVTDRSYSGAELTRAANFFNRHYAGLSLQQVRKKLQQELQQMQSDIVQLLASAVNASQTVLDDTQDDMLICGEHNLLHLDDFAVKVSPLKELFKAFEQRTELLQLLNYSNRASGISIFIGGESNSIPLEECSMVTASYQADDRIVGTLGVIGPSRMPYERVIPIVEVTAKLLSRAMSSQ